VEDETILISLVQQYANKYGITFNSKYFDDPEKKVRLVNLLQQAISGKRGVVTDEDLL
jgi:hypothetical protein